MRLVRVALSLAVLLPVRADDWQTMECMTYVDHDLRELVPQFLKNASLCASAKQGMGTVMCAEKQIAQDKRALFSPLIETIEAWEQYFLLDLNSAFLRYSDARPKVDLGQRTAYDRLLNIWDVTGQLCFYTNEPDLADRIHPQKAGLLTLFYQTDNVRHHGQFVNQDTRETRRNLRSPSLKTGGQHWSFDGRVACSAGLQAERERQVNALREMVQRTTEETYTEVKGRRFGFHYKTHFSTDIFIQAVITGWGEKYSCARGLDCSYVMERGSVYLPANTNSYLRQLYFLLEKGYNVCVIFRDTTYQLNDKYYVAATAPILV
ncbi:hypothetical protein CP533_5172 [Ophiocordyceps camponoti-saundersi (nom. inval.)]|nr:hypothetical protein CP533_5172 [Ophiocordyceps camponoti-saundersi (nom. inval.)]